METNARGTSKVRATSRFTMSKISSGALCLSLLTSIGDSSRRAGALDRAVTFFSAGELKFSTAVLNVVTTTSGRALARRFVRSVAAALGVQMPTVTLSEGQLSFSFRHKRRAGAKADGGSAEITTPRSSPLVTNWSQCLIGAVAETSSAE